MAKGKQIIFNARGNGKQLACLQAWLTPGVLDIVYGGSKGSGKSFLGCSIIFGMALMYPGTHYFIARKKLNDLRKYTKPSVVEVMDFFGIDKSLYKYNGSDNYYELYNGSRVYFLQAKYEPSDHEYARFGSMQMTSGWIEEAGEIEKDASTALMASVGRWKNKEFNIEGKVLQTCNPAKNYLYSDYYRPNKKGELEEHKKFIQALPEDNKQLPKGYLKKLNLTLSKNQKERLLKGNWEYDDDPTALCEFEDIVSIFENDHTEEGSYFLTADIARFGSDKAVLLVWCGWRVVEYVCLNKSSIKEIQDLIEHYRQKYKIPKKNCIADEDGVGGGVVDNCGIRGFVNNSKAIDNRTKLEVRKKVPAPNYNNLQSQCGYYLADQINDFELFISCEIEEKYKEEIIEELEQLKTFEADKGNALRLLPKAQIKDNIGRSPDWRDALLMRSYFELNKKFSGNYAIG